MIVIETTVCVTIFFFHNSPWPWATVPSKTIQLFQQYGFTPIGSIMSTERFENHDKLNAC